MRVAAVCSLLVLAACAAPAPTPSEAPVVAVSILPQATWVERLAGDAVRTEVLVPPGRSPDTYEPTPQQMARVADAVAYVRLGLPFEAGLLPRLERVAPDLAILDGARAISLEPIDGDGHAHGHAHGGLDPHFWLDPILVAEHVRTLADDLAALVPAHAPAIREAADGYVAELEAADERIAARMAPYAGREVFVYHPAWGYFTRRYGLRQVPVEVGGREPSPQQLTAFVEAAGAAGIHTVFVQPQFATGAARALADAVGAEIVVLDPLAPDYLDNLERIAAAVAAELERR